MTDILLSVPSDDPKLPSWVEVPAAQVTGIPDSPDDIGAATAEQGALADATKVQQVTLTAPMAYTLPTGLPSGVVHRVTFTQDNVGGHTVTYGGSPVSVDATAGAVTTVELHPVGAGYVVRYPADATFVRQPDLQEVKNVQHSLRRPVVTFVNDDNSADNIPKLRPLSVTYDIPFVTALITAHPYAVADYRDVQDNLGWEIASHSDTHYYLPAAEAVIETEHATSLAKLTAQGFHVEGIVYPGGFTSEPVRRIAKRHYRYGVATSNPVGTNAGVFPSFNIKRVGLGSYFDPSVPGLPATNTLDYYKARVDQAVTEGSWLVFMLHVGETDATQMGYLESVIQYVQSLGVDVLTLRDAYEIFGNAVESGDYDIYDPLGVTGIAISREGVSANFPNGLNIVKSSAGITNASPPTAFTRYVASATAFGYSATNGFPTTAGTLVTYRLSSDQELTFQLWHDYWTNAIYTRRWRAGAWLAWFELGTKYNDTGYRVLTSWDQTGVITGAALPTGIAPTPATNGSVRVRRSAQLVTYQIRGATWSAPSTFVVPTGFGAANKQLRAAVTYSSEIPVIVAATIDVGTFTVGAAGQKAGGSAATIITWEADTAWPSTWPAGLPGTPA